MFLSVFKNYKYYFFGALLSFIITWYLLDLSNFKLHIPLLYVYDEIFYDFVGKTLIDNSWYQINKFTGAPGATSLLDFPISGDNFHLLMLKLLALITRNGIATVNLYYIISFPLTTLVSLYVLRQMQLNSLVSLCISLLYSFTPYHFFRGTSNLLLSAYYLVPLGILLAYWVITENEIIFKGSILRLSSWNFKSRKTILILFFSVLIGSGGTYYAFFILIILGVSGIYSSSRNRSFNPFFRTILIMFVMFSTLIINLIPSILEKINKGPNLYVADRKPYESELFSFRLTQLIFPIDNHRWDAFAKFKNDYTISTALLNENVGSSLGTIASLGFIILLIWLISSRPKEINHFNIDNEKLTIFSIWVIILFLFGTIGGLGSIFSYLINPTFRSLNRVSIVISFISFATISLLLTNLFSVIKDNGYKILVCLLVLIFGIFDQTQESVRIDQSNVVEEFRSDSMFVSQIEQLSPSAQIFQLPYLEFPETVPVGNVGPYDMFKGYLHSKSLKWSFGSIKGRSQANLIKVTSSYTPKKMLGKVKNWKFNGIYIDREGFPDKGVSIEKKFKEILGKAPLISENKRLSFFDIKDYTPEKTFTIDLNLQNPHLITFSKDGNSNEFLNYEEWFDPENEFRWTKGTSASLTFDSIVSDKDILLKAEGFPFLANGAIQFQIVKIIFNNSLIGEWQINKNGVYSILLPKRLFDKMSVNSLRMDLPNASSPIFHKVNDDTRILAMGFKTITLEKISQ